MRWFIARRYLLSHSSHSVINIIATVSLIAVAIPVAAMVILLSVFNGFEQIVKGMFAQTDADIELFLDHAPTESLRNEILATKGVAGLCFVIEAEALATSEKRQAALKVRGVEQNYFDILPLDPTQLQGKSALTLSEIDYAILTRDISQLLGIYTTTASFLELHSVTGEGIGSLIPLATIRRHKFSVAGIVNATQQLSGTAIIPYRAAVELFGQGAVKGYIRCSEDSNAVLQRLTEALNGEYKITTREQKNALFYTIVRYEKWAVFLVALLVLVIASLSIIGTVVMLIVEKRDQQPTLLSMGADMNFIRGIFVREGLLISGLGGLSGLVVGIAVVLVQQHFGIIAMPSAGFVVESYPVRLMGVDLIAIFVTFVAIAWSVSQIAANSMIKKR
jgi:lipoprotein-releasing system permease protein